MTAWWIAHVSSNSTTNEVLITPHFPSDYLYLCSLCYCHWQRRNKWLQNLDWIAITQTSLFSSHGCRERSTTRLSIMYMPTDCQNFSFEQQGDRWAEASLGEFIRPEELSMYQGVIGRRWPKRPVRLQQISASFPPPLPKKAPFFGSLGLNIVEKAQAGLHITLGLEALEAQWP